MATTTGASGSHYGCLAHLLHHQPRGRPEHRSGTAAHRWTCEASNPADAEKTFRARRASLTRPAPTGRGSYKWRVWISGFGLQWRERRILADLYARWVSDPASVDPSFADLFSAMNDEARAVLEDATGASWAPRPSFAEAASAASPLPAANGVAANGVAATGLAPEGLSPDQVRAATITSLRALMLIRSYRVRGHLEARLDPLGLIVPAPHAELDPKSYGFTEADMDRPVFIDNVLGTRDRDACARSSQILRRTYCGLDRRRVHAHPGPRAEIPGSNGKSKARPGAQ